MLTLKVADFTPTCKVSCNINSSYTQPQVRETENPDNTCVKGINHQKLYMF